MAWESIYLDFSGRSCVFGVINSDNLVKNFISITGAVLLISSASLRAIPGDEHWDAQFGLPGFAGMNGDVYSITTHNGQIYASGFFTTSFTNAPVEVWNGAQWNVIGRVIGYPQAVVYDMAFVGNNLYIAGSFTNVNGIAANGLAKWDGANWSSLGSSGTTYALAVSGNNLYAAGGFTNATADGSIATNIASWDGSAWHELGGGLGVPGGVQVGALAIQNGLVYAGGLFSNSGSLAVTNLAVWNDSTWSQVGGGVNGSVYALAFYGGNLIVGGNFSQAGTTSVSGIAQWNGASWSSFGGGVASPGYVFRMAVFNGTIYAGGPFSSIGGVAATNIAYWTGSTWSPLGTGVSSSVLRLVSNATNLYVGGAFGLAGGKIVNLIASWDGANWSGIGSSGRMNGVNLSVIALASDGTNLYAGGSFIGAGQTNANFTGRFDGTNWYPLGSGIGPYASTTIVRTLAMGSNGLYAGGEFSSAGGVSAANMALWNGSNWSALGGGPGGVVASILVRTDGVYAAGAPLYGSGPNYSGGPFFSRWDGTNWNNCLVVTNTLFPELITTPNIAIDAMASIGTNIYVGGQLWLTYYDPNNFENQTSCWDIFQYNGGWAQPVGTGVNSNILAMAVIGTNLYVGGYFTNAGGITASHIARWDGANWWALSSGVVGNGNVVTLAVIGTNLYAGGNFTNMGGVSANGVARWDGNNWWPLGGGVLRSGLPSSVSGLCSSGNDLYAGGIFQTAGNKASYTVGHWNDQVNFNTPQLINPAWLPGGEFQTRLYGVPGVTNIVLATTNFVVWTSVLTNSTGIYDFTDSNSPAYPYRFYRGVLNQ